MSKQADVAALADLHERIEVALTGWELFCGEEISEDLQEEARARADLAVIAVEEWLEAEAS